MPVEHTILSLALMAGTATGAETGAATGAGVAVAGGAGERSEEGSETQAPGIK